jgi:Domain of unknown function (DUF4397)
MRLSRLVWLGVGIFAVSACSSATVTDTTLPPNASVRIINAVADTGAVDVRMVDQVDFSAHADNLGFRAGTVYQTTEAKARHIRVFPTSTNISITSQVLHDTTITFTAGSRVTALLTGSARAKTLHFVIISDATDPPPSGQIGVRMVNASSGAVAGYLVTAVGDPLPASATFSSVAPLAASAYVNRATGAAAIRATDAGSVTVNASVAGPPAPATIVGAFPGAGVTSAGTLFSVYYFPRGVAGSPQNSITTAGLVWFVDRNPCDAGC